MVNSRRKGAVGEREVAAYLREHGFTEARRGQQFHGGSDSPDVVGMTGFHIEVKRVERLDLNAAMEQSIRDAAKNEIPVVFHRRDRDYWKVTMRLDDFMKVLSDTADAIEKLVAERKQLRDDLIRRICQHCDSRMELCEECPIIQEVNGVFKED